MPDFGSKENGGFVDSKQMSRFQQEIGSQKVNEAS